MRSTDLDPAFREIANHVADKVATLLRDDPPVISPWLTPRQAAGYIGLDERSLEAKRRNNDGPVCHRVNHRLIRYHVADLDAWLRSHREGAANA